MVITPQTITNFTVRPDTSRSYNDNNVTEFKPEEDLVVEFLHASSDHRPYYPEHDRGAAHWGIQIRTQAIIITSWFYIPVDKPGIVVGNIRLASASSTATFQSHLLLRWYQKYGHYWHVGDYQKVQYSRVKPLLRSIVPAEITVFRIMPGLSAASDEQDKYAFNPKSEMVTAFVQALEDMRFAAPTSQDYLAGWTVQIRTGATTVTITCSIPAEEPPLVIGLIDSGTGYTYFQSRHLYQWYQNYKDRWLNPDEAHPPEHAEDEDGDRP